MKKVADSLHLENSPQFGEDWYQFLCEVCKNDFDGSYEYLYTVSRLTAMRLKIKLSALIILHSILFI